MKLDFESNAPNVSSVDKQFYNESNSENSSADASAQLQAGIKAARAGDRAEARNLLLRAAAAEPDNENVWMWLASVSEYPEELLGFLSHVLRINPNNERASEWTKSTKNLLSQNLVRRGTDASKDDRNDFAKQCFRQAIAQDDENETAWLRLASVSAKEKVEHLHKVLSLNPENEKAKFLLESFANRRVEGLLQKAVWSAVAGERETAKRLLEEILSKAPELVEAWVLKSFLVESFEEKIDCFEKILDVNDENELANVNWTALLDIMAKAESKPEIDDAEDIPAAERLVIDESNTKFNLPEISEAIHTSAAPRDEHSDAIQSNSRAQADERETLDTYKLPEITRLDEEKAGDFAAPETISENPAQNYTDYSQPEAEFQPEALQNNSQHTSGELSIPHDSLPSYYENEEDVFEPFETVEKDYSQEYSQPEQEVLADGRSETEATFVSKEENVSEENEINEESFTATNFTATNFSESANERHACPFCNAEDEAQSFVCGYCRAVLTLSDMETLLAHRDADQEIVRQAVEQMEDEKTRRAFGVEELKLLAVGQINLKNLRQGCAYLQEAAQMNPNDVFLSSQVNFLKIRLAEIEDQQSVHDSMPKNRKILVVDDSATVRKLISSKLEKSGHEVICAVDGLDALERIKEFVPDLILLDINMPRMDGYQVCKLIRSDEATKDVPVVMISGKDGFFDKVRGRMAGTTGYITKPFGPETLMKMVETYIVQGVTDDE